MYGLRRQPSETLHHYERQYQADQTRQAVRSTQLRPSTDHVPLERDPYSDGHGMIQNNFGEGAPRQYNVSMTPRQYAYPAQHPATVDTANNGASTLSFAEHLKRKTPRGTINAAYDASPMDGDVQLPATKHVLVDLLPDRDDVVSPSSILPHQSWTRSDFAVNPYFNQYQASISQDLSIGCQISMPNSGYHTFPGGLDSVLNQTLPIQPSQRYYLQYGSTIPTVLPATLQAFPGPTASAGTEYYGPYWPDGTFSPYRPAPIRDPRFPHDLAYDGPPESVQAVHSIPHCSFGQGLRMPLFSVDTRTYAHPGMGLGGLGNMSHHSSSSRTFPPNDFCSQSYDVPQKLPPSPSQKRLSSTNRIPSSGAIWQEPVATPYTHSLFENLRQESNKFANREHVFSWAHSVYVDLLATLQGSRRTDPYRANNHPRPSNRQFTYYPRPPRQPRSDFSGQAHDGGYRHRQQQRPHIQTHGSDLQRKIGDDVTSRPSTAIYAPAMRRPSSQWDSHDALDQNPVRLQSFSDRYSDKYGNGRRSSTSNLPMLPATYQTPLSATTNAGAALELVELFCNETSNEWVDGMLLGGCLAYGLEDYEKAMKWYQRILAHDNAHVEAMSNLAATLLMLDRREEALTHWMAAVRLRPSYFEALEHLVGLLCTSHRAREAVSTIELVERSLRQSREGEYLCWNDTLSDGESDTKSRTSSIGTVGSMDKASFDYEDLEENLLSELRNKEAQPAGFGSGGFSIPGSENNRILALVHAKGNMLYALGDNKGAATAFEDAILIAAGSNWRRFGIKVLIKHILIAFTDDQLGSRSAIFSELPKEPILLTPDKALQTARMIFPPHGNLPGLQYISSDIAQKAAISTTSNSLLSLAKIYQDNMSNTAPTAAPRTTTGVRDILALYYLSLSLQPSPSTANNVGILLAGVQQIVSPRQSLRSSALQLSRFPGVVPGSGIALALAYYNYGLNLDKNHAHLYTNLGSLLKDIGQLEAAIQMYERAVQCDGKFDIALANLANAVKDQGRVADAIEYYKRAVQANPDFAEAVCGLATALNSVCGWDGRGGVLAAHGTRDRFHVDENGMLSDARQGSGWMHRVVEIVKKQLKDGESWGQGALTPAAIEDLCRQLLAVYDLRDRQSADDKSASLQKALQSWSGHRWEGSRIVRLVERAVRCIGWQWYQDRYRHLRSYPERRYSRPTLPSSLTPPNAPTVLPFHTFTAPLSAKQIRQISQRNGLRISVSTLRSIWLPSTVFPPPPPPRPQLNVGYVSSDFNNHPLAHLMQSVFGLHSPSSVRAVCYATTSSDSSIHRRQIEREAPVFYDASSWSAERLVKQIVKDEIHVLVNLNGYTRGARNEVFAARPAPIHMSFMGFAGTLGAEWSDYVLADEISVPSETLCPWRRNVALEDRLHPDSLSEDAEDWIYSENIIFAKATFFCCDHKQSAPDAKDGPPRLTDRAAREKAWEAEQARRWKLRKELFPNLRDDAVILGNFNQLYKIDPSTFRMYLRILSRLPHAILWLLRFPDLGERNLLTFAQKWAGPSIASRIIFTDVAPKGAHITRASVVDLFLDTPECNAHTTAADVVWSGTPIVTWGRWGYKMCSRMAGSIVASALPETSEGDEAREDLLVKSDVDYESHAISLASGLKYPGRPSEGVLGRGRGRLMDYRRLLWEGRWSSRLFDTKRWVWDVERAYWEAWRKWERGEGGDIWL